MRKCKFLRNGNHKQENRFRQKLRVQNLLLPNTKAEKVEKCTTWYCKNGPLYKRSVVEISPVIKTRALSVCAAPIHNNKAVPSNLGLKHRPPIKKVFPFESVRKMRSLDKMERQWSTIRTGTAVGWLLPLVSGAKSLTLGTNSSTVNKAGSRKGGAHYLYNRVSHCAQFFFQTKFWLFFSPSANIRDTIIYHVTRE